VNQQVLESTVKYCREKGITLPTFAMMRDPRLVPESVKAGLKTIGLWDVHPANLFRITWKNEPKERGGLFGDVNHIVLPPALTGCQANILSWWDGISRPAPTRWEPRLDASSRG